MSKKRMSYGGYESKKQLNAMSTTCDVKPCENILCPILCSDKFCIILKPYTISSYFQKNLINHQVCWRFLVNKRFQFKRIELKQRMMMQTVQQAPPLPPPSLHVPSSFCLPRRLSFTIFSVQAIIISVVANFPLFLPFPFFQEAFSKIAIFSPFAIHCVGK